MSGASFLQRSARVVGALALVGACCAVIAPVAPAGAAPQTRTWTGAGDGKLWSDPQNWDTGAPQAGDSLVFPAAPTANKQLQNDYPQGTAFGAITISDRYSVFGAGIQPSSINVAASGSNGSVSLSLGQAGTTPGLIVPAGGSLTVTTAVGTSVATNMSFSLGNSASMTWAVNGTVQASQFGGTLGAGAQLIKAGSGKLGLTSVSAAAPPLPLTVQSGLLSFDNNTTFPVDIIQTGGVVGSNTTAFFPSYTGTGGTLSPGGTTGTAQLITVAQPGPPVYTGNVSLGAASVYEMDFSTFGQGADILNVAGNVSLNATSQIVIDAGNIEPYAGQSFTVIRLTDNAATLTGTFQNLPDGGTTTINGVVMDVDYSSTNDLNSGNDLVLTAQGSVYVWDGGGGGDTNWTNGANWDPPGGATDGVPPTDGTVSLQFPCVNPLVTNNSFAAGTPFRDIIFMGAGCNITGNFFKLNGQVVGLNGAETNRITAPVEFVGGGSAYVPTGGANLVFNGEVSADGGTVKSLGGGSISFAGGIVNDADGAQTTGGFLAEGPFGLTDVSTVAATLQGTVTVNSRFFALGGAPPPGFVYSPGSLANADVVLHGTSTPFISGVVGGTGVVKTLSADGGAVSPSSNSPTGGGIITAGDITLSGSAVYQPNFDGPGSTVGVDYDQLVVSPGGSITLSGSASLQPIAQSAQPPVGVSFTIVDNQGSNPVNGTFAGLPEGATVPWGPNLGVQGVKRLPMTISYVGGDGNDITVTIAGKVWDGSASANWSNGANWVGNAAPVDGDSVIFPPGAANLTNTNDIAGLNLRYVIITGVGYTLNGAQEVNLNGGIVDADTTATNTVNFPMGLDGDSTFANDGSGVLVTGAAADVTANGHTLTIGGTASVTTLGGELIGGQLIISKESTSFTSLPPLPNVGTPVVINGGAVQLGGSVNADIQVHGPGSVFTDATLTTGDISLDGDPYASPNPASSSLTPGSSNRVILNTNDLTVGWGSSVSFTVNGTTAGVNRDMIDVTGTVSAGGFLSIDAGASTIPTAAKGIPLVVIDNDGSDPVQGHFFGLPEGGSFSIGGVADFGRISYVGGDGNDVTVTIESNFVWDGEGGATTGWMTAANWSGDVLPTPGASPPQTLVFQGCFCIPANQPTYNFPNGSVFDSIRVTASGYVLGSSGNSISLNGGVFVDAQSGGTTTYNIPTTFPAPGLFTQNGGGTLDVQSVITAAGGITLSGAGNFTDLADVATPTLTVATQGLSVTTLNGTLTGLTGALVAQSGQVALDGTLPAAQLHVTGGRATGSGFAHGITVDSGTLAPGDTGTAILNSTNGAVLNAGGTYEVQLNGPVAGTNYDQLNVTGSVVPGGSLSVSLTGNPALGTVYRIINNDGADPVLTTFAGLAEGATISAGGKSLTVSYAGGDGNDVTLTVSQATVALNTAATALAEGNTGSNTSAGLSVVLSGAQGSDVVVHVQITGGSATAGTDTSALNQDLTITTGQTSVAVPLTITGDNTVEPNETVIVTLTVNSGPAGLGSPAQSTVTINNDDSATLTVANPNVAIVEGGGALPNPGPATTLTMNMSNPSASDVTFHATTSNGSATAPGDYTAVDQTFTIPAGSTSVNIPLTAVTDGIDEPDETFMVHFSNASGATLSAPDLTVTIQDLPGDAAEIVVVNADVQITEGGAGSPNHANKLRTEAATSQLVLHLSHPSSQNVTLHVSTIDGTATAPADYAAINQDFTIPAGQTDLAIPLSAVADGLDEPNETFTVHFSGAVNAALSAQDVVVTILDNDVPVVTTTTAPDDGSGGTPTTTPTTPTVPGGGGPLPVTGGSTYEPLAAGAVLVMLGGAILLIRRRRTTAG